MSVLSVNSPAGAGLPSPKETGSVRCNVVALSVLLVYVIFFVSAECG